MGKMKTLSAPKVNLQATMMARLVEKVEKKPKKCVVSSPGEVGGHGPVVTKADPITLVEPTIVDSEDSTESSRLVMRKRHRLGKS